MPTLATLGLAECVQAMRWWARRAEASLDQGEARPEAPCTLQLSATLGGRFVIDGELDALGGETLATALRLATRPDDEHGPRRAASQPTYPGNLVLVCSRRHHRLDQPGWSAELSDEAELVVTDDHRRVRSSRPPGKSPRPPPEIVRGVRRLSGMLRL